MNSFFSYLLSIIGLGLVIFIHELGHFLFAKKNGVLVEEFSIGMGPRVFSVKKGETRYSVKWIPFGGSCMMYGEIDDPTDAEETPDPVMKERSFLHKSKWQRFQILFAGALFNFILAFVLSLVVVGIGGIDRPTILGLVEGYPAEEIGMQAGDSIYSLNGHRTVTYRDVLTVLQFDVDGSPVEVVYERDGEKLTGTIVPFWEEETQRYYMGIRGTAAYRTPVTLAEDVYYSAHDLVYYVNSTFKSLGMMLTGKVSVNEVSGPVGITTMMSDTVQEASEDGLLYVFLNLFNFLILISANLGVMNLLPIPALDGGRIFLLLVELILRRPISREKEGIVNLIGFALLMTLMVFVMFNDIRMLF